MRLSFPKCALCGTEVDRFDHVENAMAGTLTLVARCHGAIQKVIITQEELLTAKITIIEAFAPEDIQPRAAKAP